MNEQRYSRWNKRTPDADATARNAMLLGHLGLIGYHVQRHAVRHPADIDDLFQSACVLFLERFGTYDGVHLNLFCRWMVQTAARLMRGRPVPVVGPLITSVEPAVYDPPPCAEEERGWFSARLHAALDQLPDERRALIVRRYGLDGGEPAKFNDLRNGKTRENAHQRVKTARDKLAELLADLADLV